MQTQPNEATCGSQQIDDEPKESSSLQPQGRWAQALLVIPPSAAVPPFAPKRTNPPRYTHHFQRTPAPLSTHSPCLGTGVCVSWDLPSYMVTLLQTPKGL